MSKVEVLSLGEAIEKGVIKPYCDKFKRYIHETYGLISDCSPYCIFSSCDLTHSLLDVSCAYLTTCPFLAYAKREKQPAYADWLNEMLVILIDGELWAVCDIYGRVREPLFSHVVPKKYKLATSGMVAELRGKCKKMNYDTTIVRGTYEVKLHGDVTLAKKVDLKLDNETDLSFVTYKLIQSFMDTIYQYVKDNNIDLKEPLEIEDITVDLSVDVNDPNKILFKLLNICSDLPTTDPNNN